MGESFVARIGGEGAFELEAVPSIEVPVRVIELLGEGKRPKVNATINGYTWRTTVAVYGGRFYVGANKRDRAGAGIEFGDIVEVTLDLDTAPRLVPLPPELARALAADPAARAAFDKLSYTHRKEQAEHVAEAKQQATRQRRLQAVLARLAGR